MYGLILEGVYHSFRVVYDDKTLEKIRHKAGVKHSSFASHEVYNEKITTRLIKAAHDVTGDTVDRVMETCGNCFVDYMSEFGYDTVLKTLGRHLSDFLNGLDNLHEYLKQSYPKMDAPSFYCEDENQYGLTLHYRTRRKGFVHYVMGQLKSIGMKFYNTELQIEIIQVTEGRASTHTVLKLNFDNRKYRERQRENEIVTNTRTFGTEMATQRLFEMFPFHIIFTRKLKITSAGSALSKVIPTLVGSKIDSHFILTRPMIEFNFDHILEHSNIVFEILTEEEVGKETSFPKTTKGRSSRSSTRNLLTQSVEPTKATKADRRISVASDTESENEYDDPGTKLRLRGQMKFIEELQVIMFIATPCLDSVEAMFDMGIYIHDLSMHGAGRDIVLLGNQHSKELSSALSKEQAKCRKLADAMKRLDREMQKTDELLYQMLPKVIAERLRSGEGNAHYCENFDPVTVLFSDVVEFDRISNCISPMAVVELLNTMYSTFDNIIDKHDVYKVETIADVLMVVSGAPTTTPKHACNIADLALDMIHAVKDITDPASSVDHIKIRIGMHSGPVVAGVVGVKMPRYCLFGDTVNTAARMESNGMAMKIHVSQSANEHLVNQYYDVETRGQVTIKGKGELTTYWLVGKVSDDKGLNIDVPSGGYNSSSTSKAIYTIAEGEEQTVSVHQEDINTRLEEDHNQMNLSSNGDLHPQSNKSSNGDIHQTVEDTNGHLIVMTPEEQMMSSLIDLKDNVQTKPAISKTCCIL